MLALLAQTYAVPHVLVELSLAGIVLLSGVVWRGQIKRVSRLESKVKGLAVALLFLVRSVPAGPKDDEAYRINHDLAVRSLTDVLKM